MTGILAWAGRLLVSFVRRAKSAVCVAGMFMASAPVPAAHEASIPSAGEIALGNPVALMVQGGAWEVNPALSGASSGWRFGAGTTHPLGFSALDLTGIWVGKGGVGWLPGWTLRWSNLQAGEAYREDLLGLDLALGRGIWQVGGGLRGGRTEFEGSPSDWTEGWTAGLLVRPFEQVTFAVVGEDLSGIHVPDPRLAQPLTFRLGASIVPSDSAWSSSLGWEGKQGRDLSFSLGQEVRWRVLVLRAGMRVDPWVLSFGAGIRCWNLLLDWTQEGDSRLGWQQHWTISVVW